MTKKQTSKILIFCLLFSCLLLGVTAGGQGFLPALAANGGTDVLSDLENDTNFSAAAYPVNRGDYSLKVIHLAESTDGGLFIYVYHPSGDKRTTATTVSIAGQLNNSDDLKPELYNLELVSNAAVLYKYKVTGFKVSKATERFYNVIMIQRPYVAELDGAQSGGITNRKGYGVGQYWYASGDGGVEYKMLEVETVQIINPVTSHIRKRKNVTGSNKTDYYQDNYYIAFSTDRNIDELISATVEYRIRDYYYKSNDVLSFGGTAFGEKAVFSNEKLTTRDVYAEETVDLEQQGFTLLFGLIDLNQKFTWDRIQTSENFIKNAGAAASDNEDVKNLQWVLMFDETSAYCYKDGSLVTVYEETGQIIDLVTVLRLEFVEDGITYNLGTVSDTVSGKPPFGGNSNGGKNPGNNIPWWVWLIVAGGVIIILYIFVKPFRYGVNFVVTAPFRLLRNPAKTKSKKAGKRK